MKNSLENFPSKRRDDRIIKVRCTLKKAEMEKLGGKSGCLASVVFLE